MSRDPVKTVMRSMYPVAAILVIVPLMDLSTRVWPLRAADTGWRFGAFGLIANFLILPVAGLALATITAAVLHHRRTLRSLAALSFAIGFALLVGSGLFALDFLQLRASVQKEAIGAFDVASVKATAHGPPGHNRGRVARRDGLEGELGHGHATAPHAGASGAAASWSIPVGTEGASEAPTPG